MGLKNEVNDKINLQNTTISTNLNQMLKELLNKGEDQQSESQIMCNFSLIDK